MRNLILFTCLAGLSAAGIAQTPATPSKPAPAAEAHSAAASAKLGKLVGELLERNGLAPAAVPPHAGTKPRADEAFARPQAASAEKLSQLGAGIKASGLIVRFSDPAVQQLAASNAPPPAGVLAAIQTATPLPLRYHRAMAGGSHVFRFDQPTDLAAASAAAKQLAALEIVERSEPDVLVRPRLSSSDDRYGEQWNMLGVSKGYAGGIDAEPAWDLTTGSRKTVIAVIDTGVLRHPDLSNRVLAGYDFVSDPAYSNDGDGRDKNATDPGDYTAANECGPGEPATDSTWHGTHVAGIAAASGTNGVGIAGVSWQALILPVRVLGKCGGDTSDIVDAIRWAAGLSVPGVSANPSPAKIINLSLGGFSTTGCSAVYQEAIDAAVGKGALVVVSAGNEAMDAAYSEPANCNNVLAVTAVDPYGEYASYTNINRTGRLFATIAAPGGDTEWYGPTAGILSTVGSGTTSAGSMTWASYEGTSMAAPHVAGVAALALARNAALSGAELLNLLQLSANPFPSGTVCASTGWCGNGIVSASRAASAAASFKSFQLVYEFYNTILNHYFRTGSAAEAAGINNGAAGAGWSDTLDYFYAWSSPTDGALPVCRFYGTPGIGPNSHFYTASAAECELVKQDPGWTYEGIAFYAKLPTAGQCPADTKAVYRAYNNRWRENDSNHRYTTDASVYQSMVAQGWAGEGIALCAAL